MKTTLVYKGCLKQKRVTRALRCCHLLHNPQTNEFSKSPQIQKCTARYSTLSLLSHVPDLHTWHSTGS